MRLGVLNEPIARSSLERTQVAIFLPQVSNPALSDDQRLRAPRIVIAKRSATMVEQQGGYHHQVGYNVFAAGSPVASDSDPRVLFWELMLPDAASVSATAGRLRQVASSYDERDLTAPSFVDFDGIRVVLRSELQ